MDLLLSSWGDPAPKSDSIRDAEGRFGSELKRTRDIFFKATPRSLIILDELAEATTYKEKQRYLMLYWMDSTKLEAPPY